MSEFRKRYLGELPQQMQANLATLEALNTQLRLNSDNQVRAVERRQALVAQLAEAESFPQALAAPGAPAAGPEPPAAPPRPAQAGADRGPHPLHRRAPDRDPAQGGDRRRRARPGRRQARGQARGGGRARSLLPASTCSACGSPSTPPSPSSRSSRPRTSASAAPSPPTRLAWRTRRSESRSSRTSRGTTIRPERTHQSLVKRYEEAQLAESMEQRQKGEQFRVLDPALPSTVTAAPNRLQLLMMALVLSVGLAAGVAILAEMLDTSFHSADDLRAFTTVPVLVSIPRIVTEADLRQRRLRFRLVGVGGAAGGGPGRRRLLLRRPRQRAACSHARPRSRLTQPRPWTSPSSACESRRSIRHPDPRFLHLTPAHQEALAQLLYGVQQHKGFILLTGEVGTGKTTLLHALLERLDDTAAVAFVTNSMLGFDGILEYMLEDLGIAKPGESSPVQRLFALQNFLIERGRTGQNTVLILDEAQDLDPRDSRADPAPLQLRDDEREDLADPPRRPARAPGQARSARAPPAQAAHRAPLPHPAPRARAGPRLHQDPAPGRRRARPRTLLPGGGRPDRRVQRRDPAPREHGLRSLPPVRLRRPGPPHRPRHRGAGDPLPGRRRGAAAEVGKPAPRVAHDAPALDRTGGVRGGSRARCPHARIRAWRAIDPVASSLADLARSARALLPL